MIVNATDLKTIWESICACLPLKTLLLAAMDVNSAVIGICGARNPIGR